MQGTTKVVVPHLTSRPCDVHVLSFTTPPVPPLAPDGYTQLTPSHRWAYCDGAHTDLGAYTYLLLTLYNLPLRRRLPSTSVFQALLLSTEPSHNLEIILCICLSSVRDHWVSSGTQVLPPLPGRTSKHHASNNSHSTLFLPTLLTLRSAPLKCLLFFIPDPPERKV